MDPNDADPTYPAAFVWFARLIVLGIVIQLVVELIQGIRKLFQMWRK